MNINKLNESMLVDFYEFTMTNGYFISGIGEKKVIFDMFFRKVPDNGSFAIMAGLEQVVEYIENLHFTDEDIEYLDDRRIFCKDFLAYLKDFKFTCDIDAISEGTPIFPQEPIVRVKGPLIQAQFIETMLLMHINHQSLIATSIEEITGRKGFRNHLISEILNYFEVIYEFLQRQTNKGKEYILSEYKKRFFLLGHQVWIIDNKTKHLVTILDIDKKDAFLIVKNNKNEIIHLKADEISLKLQEA